MNQSQNNLAEKLACDDGLDIEFERIDLNLREIDLLNFQENNAEMFNPFEF